MIKDKTDKEKDSEEDNKVVCVSGGGVRERREVFGSLALDLVVRTQGLGLDSWGRKILTS
jgi:hypothetical protein